MYDYCEMLFFFNFKILALLLPPLNNLFKIWTFNSEILANMLNQGKQNEEVGDCLNVCIIVYT